MEEHKTLVMRNILIKLLLAVALTAIGADAWSQSAFAVRATQDGDNIIVTYYLDEPAESVRLTVSTDGGKTFSAPLKKVSGDLVNVSVGGRHSITWNVLEEYDSFVGDEIVFEVLTAPDKSKTGIGATISGPSEPWVNGRTVGRRFGSLYWKDTGKKLSDYECQKFLGEDLLADLEWGRSLYWGGYAALALTGLSYWGWFSYVFNADDPSIFLTVSWVLLSSFGVLFSPVILGSGIANVNSVKKAYNSRNSSPFGGGLNLTPSVQKTFDNNYAVGATLNFSF